MELTDEQANELECQLNGFKALEDAAKRLVELGDAGVFMTCETGGEDGPQVRLKCTDTQHAQGVHQAIGDIVKAVRALEHD